ncbi:MAG TPA: VOC family protein [Roseiflexaceae bacterium]|nr:VOC family protein [Roseiflexaceae bacterium]
MSDSPSLPPATRIGAVTLAVADLGRSLEFYQQALGFRLHRRADGTAALGAGGPDLLRLVEQPGARPARGVTGLYHFAVLVPTRRDLARSLRRLAELRTPLQGMSDHAVSEAIYLADPDGNGIEIYRDRPRAEWPRAGPEVRMTVEPLDLDGLLGELAGDEEPWSGLRPATTIGHMHLHVADIAAARQFYVGVLGFELMQRFGAQAEFVAAGGYHHHIAYNIWAGRGAPPPAPDMAGLRSFEVLLPDQAALEAALSRVRAAGLPVEQAAGGTLVRDPSQNAVVLTV